MKKISAKHIIILVVISLLIYLLVWLRKQKQLYDKSCFKLTGGRVNELNASNANIDIKLLYKNKNDINFYIQNQEYDVYFNDTMIAHIQNREKIFVRKHEGTPVNLNIKFVPKDVLKLTLKNLQDLILNRNNIKVRIVGNLSLGSSFIFINKVPMDLQYTLGEILAPSTTGEKC
jgi:LEA14-like dessication related protein